MVKSNRICSNAILSKAEQNSQVAATPYKLVIFDVDGTLRGCHVKGQPCPNSPDEQFVLPGVVARAAQIPDETRIGIVSNQAGVGLKYMKHEMAQAMIHEVVAEIWPDRCMEIHVEICPHIPSQNCACRKPKPGMLLKVMKRAKVQGHETLFVGDMQSDKSAADAAGCHFQWAEDYFSESL